MTFDDWLDEYYPSSERPDDPNYYLIVAMRAAWNAAIDAANTKLHEKEVSLVPTRMLLEALKTPLEGSNDSEVVHG